MMLKATVVVLLSLVPFALQECVNQYGFTRCWNLLPKDAPLIVENPLPKFEIQYYSGPFNKLLFQNLTNITQLSITKCDLTEIEPDTFCALPWLKFISFYESRIPNITVDTFGHCCPRVETIGFQQTYIQDVEGGSFQYFGRLRVLHFEFSTLSLIRKDTFKGLTQVGHLSVKGNRIEYVEEGGFNDLTNVRILNLSNNRLTDVPIEELKKLIALEDLYLTGNRFSHFDVNALLPSLPNLKFLAFMFNIVECDELKEIEDILDRYKVYGQVFQKECKKPSGDGASTNSTADSV